MKNGADVQPAILEVPYPADGETSNGLEKMGEGTRVYMG